MTFNESELLEHFDNDKEMISDLIEVLEETYPETLANLKAALDAQTFAEIELHAHTLKGMLSNFFCDELKEKAFELEKMGREKSLDHATEKYSELEKQIPGLLQDLRSFCG